jgi:hypothetical protein
MATPGWEDKEAVLKAVQRNGSALKCASEALAAEATAALYANLLEPVPVLEPLAVGAAAALFASDGPFVKRDKFSFADDFAEAL